MTDSSAKRHVHFDPVGGIAGDMFVAAMLDAFPQLHDICWQDLEDSGVCQHVALSLLSGKSHGMAVKRFCVKVVGDKPRVTGHYRDIRKFLQNSVLDTTVLTRALALFELLAQAESRVHGVALDDVHFHEVADWDSVADIVAAASLIEHSKVDSWSCSRLPTGSGLVKTEHGMLPIPAPATLVLLEGLTTWDDGVSGERVTPTGATIVKYLIGSAQKPHRRASGELVCSGMGAGQRELSDRPNILRCSLIKSDAQSGAGTAFDTLSISLEPANFSHETDQVVQLDFAVDDMSSEELAVALQYVRQSDGVIDVSHSMSFGKKGRLVFDITVLCLPQQEPEISRLCFAETSTLGLRIQLIARRVLIRRELQLDDGKGCAKVKIVQRPTTASDQTQETLKVESDDLRRIEGLYARRKRARELVNSTGNKSESNSSPEDS